MPGKMCPPTRCVRHKRGVQKTFCCDYTIGNIENFSDFILSRNKITKTDKKRFVTKDCNKKGSKI